MSKQSEAKEAQGYLEKPLLPMCSNCALIKTEVTYPDPNYPAYYKEKNTCSIGGFVVKKQGNCNRHQFKTQ